MQGRRPPFIALHDRVRYPAICFFCPFDRIGTSGCIAALLDQGLASRRHECLAHMASRHNYLCSWCT